MGDHPLYVRFPDGEIRHGLYRSSCDLALPELFESLEAGDAAGWHRNDRYDDALDETGEAVQVATNYGYGFRWTATATKDWLTSGRDPLRDGIDHDGLPRWLTEYTQREGEDA